ncbi:CCT4 [Lepeophtheirus salmonis]|uniref:T-complex protein 1 subunit delta n=1 Tax=Lepeophtheirus salmonis TaxID=72036 RepID=A0A7R8H0T3_LEPSM|nr:CCT4 [Lepeophtheirus salmonis]CAF2775236.1 CCT4 [Lepeophtheirus salmonis]
MLIMYNLESGGIACVDSVGKAIGLDLFEDLGAMKMKGNTSKGLMTAKYSKPAEIRSSNIQAGRALADAVRTSLGPKGMDKMIQDPKGDVIITNDGATILDKMRVVHPSAKMLVELSKAQDAEAGDGTTTVVVLAGSLLEAADKLLKKGIHPSIISESFQKAALNSVQILTSMAGKVDLSDRESLLKSANTSLNSKVVSQNASQLNSVNLHDIHVIKQLGGTVEDTELVDGLVLTQRAEGTTKKVEKAKIGLIQFQVSPPKTDMDNQVVVSDYAAMDRVLREERAYILNIVKQIKKAGCNVLLIQKSILRDALSDLAIHFFDKMKIMVVKDVEREDIDFICKTLGCRPIASLDHFTSESLVEASLVAEVQSGTSKSVRFTGIQNPGKTVSIVIRGSNKLMLEEAERSFHDALCVIRCLVKKRYIIAGGGAPETELFLKLKNAGLNPISTVTELRNRHARGELTAGINVRKGTITNILEENVVQPLLVSTSAISLAAETVRSILKIDDIVNAVRG